MVEFLTVARNFYIPKHNLLQSNDIDIILYFNESL